MSEPTLAPSRTIRFGLIGLGNINRAHLEGYRAATDAAEVVAVCDAVEATAQELASGLDATAYADYRHLLADGAVDAVDVTLPHHLHYPVVREALDAGKHVLVEKPFALTALQCRELIDSARAKDLVLTVAENTRFVSAYQQAKLALDADSVGAVRTVRTLIYGSEVPRLRSPGAWIARSDTAGGGVIIDAGVHSFYLLEWLFAPVARVRASSATLISEAEVEDNAVVTGELAGGTLFTCELTCTAELPWGERLEVYGERGSLIIDQMSNPVGVLYGGAEDFEGSPLPGVAHDPRGWKIASIAEGVVDFVHAVRDRRPPAVDPEAGCRAVLVAEKAYASLAAGGAAMSI